MGVYVPVSGAVVINVMAMLRAAAQKFDATPPNFRPVYVIYVAII